MASVNRTLKVGVIGLGDIAQKAYLPVLTAQPGLELHLHTRTPATLDRVGDAHRLPHRHATLDGLLAEGLDAAFVHAPTEHPPGDRRAADRGGRAQLTSTSRSPTTSRRPSSWSRLAEAARGQPR